MPLSCVTSTIRKWLNLPDIQTLTCCHLHWLALGQAPSCLAWLILTFSLFVSLYPSCPPNHMAASEWFLISFINQITWSLSPLRLFQIQSKDLYHNLQTSIGNNGKKWSLYSSAPLLLPLPFLCLLLSPHPMVLLAVPSPSHGPSPLLTSDKASTCSHFTLGSVLLLFLALETCTCQTLAGSASSPTSLRNLFLFHQERRPLWLFYPKEHPFPYFSL